MDCGLTGKEARMTPMKVNPTTGPPRVNWMTRTLNHNQFSFKRQASEHWRRVVTGKRSWRRGRGKPS
jgi:hypothetical protein